MTINAEYGRHQDLVNRYAARVRARHSGATVPARSSRRSHGIHTFGRRPVTRSRAGAARSGKAITTLMATAIMAASTSAVTASASSYQVQQGDTLTQIAQNHGMSVDDLVRINNLEDPDRIEAGTDLQLGGQPDAQSEVQIGDTIYEVREGDTLFGIATEHGVSLQDLLAINEIENENVVHPGEMLVIPTGSMEEAEPVQDGAVAEEAVESDEPAAIIDQSHIVSLHLVAPGETVGSIAQRYGITDEQFMKANEMTDPAALTAGSLVRIPDASWVPPQQAAPQPEQETSSSMLEGMPVQPQSLSLSSAPAALSMATAYWAHQVSEWVFIENIPEHQNPHRGFRGDMNGEPGAMANYGVYPKPLATVLSNYGFIGDEFYTMGDTQELKERIDRGQPVLVWMTSGASHQNRFYEWYQGERFSLVPHAHVVVAYGYDDDSIHVADPGTGQHVAYSWSEFVNSWGMFDGMSMAVYPKG